MVSVVSSVADPDPHGSAFKNTSRIRIQEIKKLRKCTGSLGELNWKIESKGPLVILKNYILFINF